jgi:hypothetical protein
LEKLTDRIKGKEVNGRTWHARDRKMGTGFYCETPKQRDNKIHLGIDRSIILKMYVK